MKIKFELELNDKFIETTLDFLIANKNSKLNDEQLQQMFNYIQFEKPVIKVISFKKLK